MMKTAFALLLISGTFADDEKFSRQEFERVHGLMKPAADEWQWLTKIPWARSFAEARRKAAEEGKPIYIWGMAGEPLGQS